MSTNAKMIRIGALAAAAALLYFTLSRPDAAPAPAAAPEADYFPFVRSMAGTRPDGELQVAPGDKLVVDAELEHLFDYYLAGMGEQSLDAIKTEIEKELARRLQPGPAAEARRLLGNYLGYKRALAGAEAGLAPPGSLAQGARARLEAMQRLRASYFSAQESAGLFGFSDAYDADAIARLDINEDKSLDAQQKQRKLAELDRKMPPALREEREAPGKVIRVEEAAAQLRANGAGDDDVYRMRAAAISPEAAGRLADVDREEAEWKRRIGAYLAQRATLQSRAAVQDTGAALQQLRDAQFSADEQKRLGAYE